MPFDLPSWPRRYGDADDTLRIRIAGEIENNSAFIVDETVMSPNVPETVVYL